MIDYSVSESDKRYNYYQKKYITIGTVKQNIFLISQVMCSIVKN